MRDPPPIRSLLPVKAAKNQHQLVLGVMARAKRWVAISTLPTWCATAVNDADRLINLSNRVAVGDGGEGHFRRSPSISTTLISVTIIIQIPDGCYDAVLRSDGICQMDRWVPTDQGTKRLPDAILNYGQPLYPGDTGHSDMESQRRGLLLRSAGQTAVRGR